MFVAINLSSKQWLWNDTSPAVELCYTWHQSLPFLWQEWVAYNTAVHLISV